MTDWRDPSWYAAQLPPDLLTPALAIYPDAIRQNVAAALKLFGGDAGRWRPHLKTVKAAFAMRLMVELGVTQAKCATLLELETACASGFRDVVVSMSLVGPAVNAVQAIAKAYPAVRIAALVEAREHVSQWHGTGFPLFIDINPGMNRTGLDQEIVAEIAERARQIRDAGCTFAGLHYYDGHVTDDDMDLRCSRAHEGYRKLVNVADALEADGLAVPEIITAGTMTFPCSLSFAGFRGRSFRHTCSPGTIVYSDLPTQAKLPEDYGFRPAALVLSRVLSRPNSATITLDAGHKAVSVDSGVPSCLILELPAAVPQKPSEEHLPVDVSALDEAPAVGTLVHLVPKHVCPTVNNFNHCVVIEGGRVTGVESITARGRHAPLSLSDQRAFAAHPLIRKLSPLSSDEGAFGGAWLQPGHLSLPCKAASAAEGSAVPPDSLRA